MAVYDISYLDREIHTKGTMLLEEIEEANRLARRRSEPIEITTGQEAALPEQRSDDLEYVTSSHGIKKENIDPSKGTKRNCEVFDEQDEGQGGFPDDKMQVMLTSRTDGFYSDEEMEGRDYYHRHYSTDKRSRCHPRKNSESFYSKFCRDQKVSLPQHGDRATDAPHVDIRIPETSSESINKDNSKQAFSKSSKHDPDSSGFLETEKHDQLPFDNLVVKKESFEDDIYERQIGGEELVYVEESQPILPAPLETFSLKYTANGDKCTLGEVAEKVMEINVDDPYDLCSLLAAENKEANDTSMRRRSRKISPDGSLITSVRRNKSLLSSMLPKDTRSRKLKMYKYPYKCSRCDSWFVDSVDLKVHMSTHKEKSFKSVKDFIHEKIFKKPEIDKGVVTTPPLFLEPEENIINAEPIIMIPTGSLPLVTAIPVMQTAQQEPSMVCEICKIQFRNITDLHIHMEQHNEGRRERPEHHSVKQTKVASSNNLYKCTSCPASFGTSFNLKRHMRIHTGTRPYKCAECHSAFITKAQLTTHMRTHTGEKPYKCHICGGKFIQQNNLKRHIMTHTGEKPFKCDKCSAAFISSSDLKRHIRVHTGEKPYKCLHCNKGFTTSGNLSSHYKMHTGEKPYKCHLCSASFSHQSNLKTHVKRHMVPYKCMCGEAFSKQDDLMSHMKGCADAGDITTVDPLVDESSCSS